MKLRSLVCFVALFVACVLSSAAQDRGYWRAASNNARAITGDIAIGESSVTINFTRFTLAPIRSLKSPEVASAFDADASSGVTGELYRLSIPSERRFLHHNTLCGTQNTTWMATYVSGRTLQIAFFSGDEAPVFTMDALSNSATRCGAFSYSR